MGVFTALVLLLKGYNVDLISHVFPENKVIFDGRPDHMASQIAAGVFLPTFFDQNKKPYETRVIRETFDLIAALERQNKFDGIQKFPYIVVNSDYDKMNDYLPPGVVSKSEPIWVTFDDKVFLPAMCNESYQLDGVLFFYEIFTYLRLFENTSNNSHRIKQACDKMDLILDYFGVNYKERNVGKLTLTQRKLTTLNEVLNLETDFIFNCTGAFSKRLFPDDNLIPLKGTMIYFKNNNHFRGYFEIHSFDHDKFTVIRSANHIAIGSISSKDPMDRKIDEALSAKLFDKANKFFKPKL